MTSKTRSSLTRELDDALVTLDYLLVMNKMNYIDDKQFRAQQLDKQIQNLKMLVGKARKNINK